MKILIISDDYSEQKYLHTLLAKIGIVAESAANPHLIAEVMLSFNPEVIIVSGKSKKFEGKKVCGTLKKKHPGKKTVLLMAELNGTEQPSREIDGYLQAPVMSSQLIELLSQITKLDKDVFLEKIKKVSGQALEKDSKVRVKGKGDAQQADKNSPPKVPETVLSMDERKKRYQQFITDKEPIDPTQAYPSEKIRSFNKFLRANQDLGAEEKNQAEKGEFVKALFQLHKK